MGGIEPSLADKFGLPEAITEEEIVPVVAIDPVVEPTGEDTLTATGEVPAEVDVMEGVTEAIENVDDLVYLNATDVDIKDMIKQISKTTGTNFLLDDKLRGKVTIISEKPMTKDMAYQAFLSALQVMGFTTVQTPAGLIKIVSTKGVISEPLDIYKDQLPPTDRFITRILQVGNISANDLSSVIKSLVSKEGNLFAYPQTNSLIITDSGSNIDRILRIVKELDQEGPQEVLEIIPIQYADATDVTDKILKLYENQIGAAAESGARGGARRRVRGGEELSEAPAISKVIADERTNSMIVLGSKRSILKLRALVARLDTPAQGAEGSIHVYYMKHANAKEMSEVLSTLVSGATTKDDSKKGKEKAAAGAVQLEGGVKVTADDSTNSLVITASPKDFQTLIEQVVAKLDIPRRQVYLEAVVMELTVKKSRTMGFSGNFGNLFNLAGNKLSGFGAILPTTAASLPAIATSAGGLGAGVFSDRTIDITSADGSTTTSIPAISAILQALQADTDANVLSTPSILTLDNEEAQIQVGNEIGVPSGQTVAAAGTSFNVSREDTGIILKVTPQISESNTVRLQLSQEITNVLPGADPALGPTLSKRAVQTVVVAHDKQTIVIGGLLEDNSEVGTNKVPFLGDVPVVGNFFKNRKTTKTKTNILIFLTPYVIRDRSDYMGILQKKIEERNFFIDLNYGYGQRKRIRKALREHATHLLAHGSVGDNLITTYESPAPGVDERAPHVFPTQQATPPVVPAMKTETGTPSPEKT